jgi:hypothetical protein
MASREEEKRKRREEREAQQRAAEQAGKRKRLVMIGGAIAAAIAVIVVGVVIAAGGGGDDEMAVGATGASAEGAPIPEQQEKDFDAAVKAAGCTFTEHPNEGSTHQSEPFDDYKTNPPTSGNHNPVPAEDGVYAPGNEPNKENWVHSLEHGRVLFQYAPGSSAADVRRLTALAQEELEGTAGYHTLVLQNNTDMDAKFAAVAWTRYVTCDELGEPQLQVMRDFREAYTDKAPELIP